MGLFPGKRRSEPDRWLEKQVWDLDKRLRRLEPHIPFRPTDAQVEAWKTPRPDGPHQLYDVVCSHCALPTPIDLTKLARGHGATAPSPTQPKR